MLFAHQLAPPPTGRPSRRRSHLFSCGSSPITYHLSPITYYLLLITSICLGALSAKADFAPYAIIIERAIFGRGPARPVAAAAAVDAAEQRAAEALARKITMCAVNRTPSGHTAVGLIDNETKPPRNFYLNVGDTESGITILAADYDAETAVIAKDGVTITLQLGKGLIGVGAEAAAELLAAAAASAPAAVPANPFSDPTADATAPKPPRMGMVHRPSQPGMPPMPGIPGMEYARMEEARLGMLKVRQEGGDVQSYKAQLRERRAAEKEAKAAAEAEAREMIRELASKITEEELRNQERLVNLSLLDQGAHPISDIALTEEEEAYFVNKGVLAE